MTKHNPKPIDAWQEFFGRYCKDQLDILADKYPNQRSITVNYPDLERFDIDMAEELLESPKIVLSSARVALVNIELGINKTFSDANVRVCGVPTKVAIRNIRNAHRSKLICIDGMVRNVTEVKPRITEAAFRCARCYTMNDVPQTEVVKPSKPIECGNEMCAKKGLFAIDFTLSSIIDAQRIRLQEMPENLHGDEQPKTIDVTISDDFAGIAFPGDKVCITGRVRMYQKSSQDGKSQFLESIFEAIHIEIKDKKCDKTEITDKDVEEIRRLASSPTIHSDIISSIAPSIYGHKEVKESIALQLFSGVAKNLPDGTRIRGDIHILLAGDSGISKSQLLRSATNLAPRGIFASGNSLSIAGLTATAVKDDFGDSLQMLEAGALVLADMGLVAVDEMDKMGKMTDNNCSALYEAMDQQQISVNEAGISTALKSRCAVLGAANPKLGRFDPSIPFVEQINMPPTLISNFDLVFVLQDAVDVEFDSMLSKHVIGVHRAGEILAHAEQSNNPMHTVADADLGIAPIKALIPIEMLRKYILYAKMHVNPVLDDDAAARLDEFYVNMRQNGASDNSAIPITARQLEGLIRLTEASARLRLSDFATVEDAKRAIRTTKACSKQVVHDEKIGQHDADVLSVWVSKSQDDKFKVTRAIIKEIETKCGGYVPLGDLADVLNGKHGIDRDEVDKILAEMSRQGQILRPIKDHVKCI